MTVSPLPVVPSKLRDFRLAGDIEVRKGEYCVVWILKLQSCVKASAPFFVPLQHRDGVRHGRDAETLEPVRLPAVYE